MNLQLYGLYRSGTNYLAWLVEENFSVRVWHGTKERHWKHGIPHEIPGRDGYLITMKDPLAWLASRERYRPEPVADLCREYNEMGWRYVHFAALHPALIIRYEDLLTGLEASLDRIAGRFGLEPGEYRDQPNRVTRGGDEMRGDDVVTDEPFDPTYYTDKRYLNDLSAQTRVLADMHLDHDLCERLYA